MSLPLQKFTVVGVTDGGISKVLIVSEVNELAAKVLALRNGFRWCVVLSPADVTKLAEEVNKP